METDGLEKNIYYILLDLKNDKLSKEEAIKRIESETSIHCSNEVIILQSDLDISSLINIIEIFDENIEKTRIYTNLLYKITSTGSGYSELSQILSIFSHACSISREILCLTKNSFPDGAFALLRKLTEVFLHVYEFNILYKEAPEELMKWTNRYVICAEFREASSYYISEKKIRMAKLLESVNSMEINRDVKADLIEILKSNPENKKQLRKLKQANPDHKIIIEEIIKRYNDDKDELDKLKENIRDFSFKIKPMFSDLFSDLYPDSIIDSYTSSVITGKMDADDYFWCGKTKQQIIDSISENDFPGFFNYYHVTRNVMNKSVHFDVSFKNIGRSIDYYTLHPGKTNDAMHVITVILFDYFQKIKDMVFEIVCEFKHTQNAETIQMISKIIYELINKYMHDFTVLIMNNDILIRELSKQHDKTTTF